MILIINAWHDTVHSKFVFIWLLFIKFILDLRQVINLIIFKQFIRTKLESLTDLLILTN